MQTKFPFLNTKREAKNSAKKMKDLLSSENVEKLMRSKRSQVRRNLKTADLNPGKYCIDTPCPDLLELENLNNYKLHYNIFILS